jgi:hypothetical protein
MAFIRLSLLLLLPLVALGAHSALGWNIYSVEYDRLTTVDLSSDRPLIVSNHVLWYARQTDTKTKYYKKDNQLWLAAKGSDSQFKLKNENDELVAKVKLKGGDITLCTDDECSNPNKIKAKQNKLKEWAGGIDSLLLNHQQYWKEGQQITHEIKPYSQNLSFLVLEADEFDYDTRLVLLVELLKRGY